MGEPLRVLIVEDSQDDATLMLHHLQRGGFSPILQRVESPEAMRAALETSTPDVILADYSLPSFGAPQALTVLRKTGLDIPFLVVSGSIGEDIAVSCMQAGASDYIMKDKLPRLVPAIRRELRESEGRRARRSAEHALRESEARYRLLVENTSDIITMTTLDGTLLYASPSIERVLGQKPEELVGTQASDLLHPDDRESFEVSRNRLRETGGEIDADFRFRHKDGSWRIIEMTAALKGSYRGEPVVLGTGRDSTERRALEDQLRQSQKMEAVGRLAGGVAHDFNNLLTAIMGYSELLIERLKGQPELVADVIEVRKASERAAGLTRQLLAFSRRQVLAPRVIDLNEVVGGLGEMIRRLIGEDIELSVVVSSDLGSTVADPGQIEQVMMNLVVNARDAMPQGGRLLIETANVDLDEAYARTRTGVTPGHFVMLAVSDTGAGMDAETQSHLFEPFYTTKEKGKGTGLGLSTVYGIVKQTGGNIWVYSEPGHGTTFKIYLPRVQEEVDRIEAMPAPVALPKGVETILLVEDEDSVRTLIRNVLMRQGYQVLDARNGDEALTVSDAHEAPIQLLISDVVMPGMGGDELAKELVSRRPKTRVLFISGYTDRSVMIQGQLDPDTRFLQKPFTPDTLLRKVHEVIHGVPVSGSSASRPR